MNVTINTGAALDDAKQILDVIDRISSSMETLDKAIKNTIPSGIKTTWSETVSENWGTYYTADIPDAMANMRLSAENIKRTVDQTEAYSMEQD